MIELDLVGYLQSVSSITDIVGQQIWFDHVPQKGGSYPALTWEKFNSEHFHHLQGSAGAAVASFDITACSRDLIECYTLAEAVRLCLQGFSGQWGETSTITSVVLDDDSVGVDPNQDGSDYNWVNKKTLSFNVHYKETIPSF